MGAQIVLCLHDELLVHVPIAAADDVGRRGGCRTDRQLTTMDRLKHRQVRIRYQCHRPLVRRQGLIARA